MSNEDREKWNERYAEPSRAPQLPSQHLLNLVEVLPTTGRALDIAGGAGRHAIWLAQRGLLVTLVDISANGLAIAKQRAEDVGVPLQALCQDLEHEPLPLGPWDVIVSFHFLERKIWPEMRCLLAPGGILVFVQPTVRNLELHPRPPRGFLLDEGEGLQIATGLEIVRYDEGWLCEGRHEVVVVARRNEAAALQ